MTPPARRPVPLQPAWTELRAVFGAARSDWDTDDAEAAVIAVQTAGVAWGRAFREAARLILDPDGTPAKLRELASVHGVRDFGPGYTLEERQELVARALANCEAASEVFDAQRRTGPIPRVPEQPP